MVVQTLKKTAVRTATALPLYRAIPFSSHRDYSAIHYLNRHAPSRIPDYIETTGRLPDLRYSTLHMAAASAFRQGRDELVDRLATRAREYYPEAADIRVIAADLAAFRGKYLDGLQEAETAWLLNPDSTDAARRTARLAGMIDDPERAEVNGLAALEAFPTTPSVLWAVCKNCRDADQFDRMHTRWRARAYKPDEIALGARPMANAAIRAELFDRAAEIYAEAGLFELHGEGLNSPVKEKQLRGRGGLSVIKDLQVVFEKAGVRWFLAAGTALGIIRDGRPLDHDSDIDVGVFEEDWDRERIRGAFLDHPNFDFDIPHPGNPKLGLIHRGGATIDLFNFYRDGDRLYHDGVFVRWANSAFGLKEHKVGKTIVRLPDNPEQYLTENYGDWKTPDPDFDAFVHGPNAETKWPRYMAIHRMRRAYKFLRARDFIRARAELAETGELLHESEAGRILAGEMQL